MCAPEASALRSWNAALSRRHDRYHLRPYDEHRAVLAVCKLEGIIGDLIQGAFTTLIGQSGRRHNAHLLADKQLMQVPIGTGCAPPGRHVLLALFLWLLDSVIDTQVGAGLGDHEAKRSAASWAVAGQLAADGLVWLERGQDAGEIANGEPVGLSHEGGLELLQVIADAGLDLLGVDVGDPPGGLTPAQAHHVLLAALRSVGMRNVYSASA